MCRGEKCFPFLLAFLILISPMISFGQGRQQTRDVVYLKDGSIIRGTIIEKIPLVSVKIQTIDGSVSMYSWSEIQRTQANPALGKPPRLPGIAFLWSCFIPGAGQVYNGQMIKGALIIAAMTSGFCMLFNGLGKERTRVHQNVSNTGGCIFLGAWIYSVIDAPISASRINRERGWATAPFSRVRFAVAITDVSRSRKMAPGIVLTWDF
jgi:hypothetical protein